MLLKLHYDDDCILNVFYIYYKSTMNITIQNAFIQIRQLQSKIFQNPDLSTLIDLVRRVLFGNSIYTDRVLNVFFIIVPLYTKTIFLAIKSITHYLKKRIRYVPPDVINIRDMYTQVEKIMDQTNLKDFKSTLKTCISILNYYINFGSKQMESIPQFQTLTSITAGQIIVPLVSNFIQISREEYIKVFGDWNDQATYAAIDLDKFYIGLISGVMQFRLSFPILQMPSIYIISCTFDQFFYWGLDETQLRDLIDDFQQISSTQFFSKYTSSKIMQISDKHDQMAEQLRKKLDEKVEGIYQASTQLNERQQQMVLQLEEIKSEIKQRKLLIESLIIDIQNQRRSNKNNLNSNIQNLMTQIDQNRSIVKKLELDAVTMKNEITDLKMRFSKIEERTSIIDANSKQQMNKQNELSIQLKKKLQSSEFDNFKKQYQQAKSQSQQSIKFAKKELNRLNVQLTTLNEAYETKIKTFQSKLNGAAFTFQTSSENALSIIKSESMAKLRSMQTEVKRYKTTIDTQISNLTKTISESITKSDTTLSQFKEATSEDIQDKFEFQRKQNEKMLEEYRKVIAEQTLKQVSRLNEKFEKKTDDLKKNKVSFQAFMGLNYNVINKSKAIDKKLAQLDQDKVSLDKYYRLGDKMIEQKLKMKLYVLDQTKIERQQSIKRTDDQIKQINSSLKNLIRQKVNTIQTTMKKLRDSIAKISAQQRLLSQRIQQLKEYFDEKYRRLNAKVDDKSKKVNSRVDDVKRETQIIQKMSQSRYQKSIRFTLQQSEKLRKRIQVNQIKSESDFIERQYRQNSIFRYQVLTNPSLRDRYRDAKYQMQEQVKNTLKKYQ